MTRYADLPPFPERVRRLDELAANLWWSWQYHPRKVFRDLDYQLWRATAHNPVKMLRLVTRERLEQMSRDEDFLNTYDKALEGLDAATAARNTWMARRFPELQNTTSRIFRPSLRFISPAVAAGASARLPATTARNERPRRSAGRRRVHVIPGVFPSNGLP
jgi:glucan phosphorylase